MSRDTYASLEVKPTLKVSKTGIFRLGQQKVAPFGVIDFECKFKGKPYKLTCEVINGNVRNLLSLEDSIKLQLVKRVNVMSKSKSTLPAEIRKCPHASAVRQQKMRMSLQGYDFKIVHKRELTFPWQKC
jgi:hypothetical protein